MTTLLDSPALRRLRGASAGKKETVDARVSTIAAVFFERFAAETKTLLAAERFDSAAARIWLAAKPPPILADQSALIRRLLERRRSSVSTPLVTSYEEQDPHCGRWVLSTLVLKEYGAFKIVNNSYIHLNNPPTTLPPRDQHIHLCWGAGWNGAAGGASSALHAVVALLADDWRAALARLPVQIELHRMNPSPASAAAGRGRRRWSDGTPPVPPAPAVAALFARANAALALGPWHIANDAEAASRRSGRRDWWCACLLEADLPRLGFARGIDPLHGGATASWSARRSTLPEAIEHVIVVPPTPAAGDLYAMRSSADLVALEPVRSTRSMIVDDDYWKLRVAALDLVLGELAARMY